MDGFCPYSNPRPKDDNVLPPPRTDLALIFSRQQNLDENGETQFCELNLTLSKLLQVLLNVKDSFVT